MKRKTLKKVFLLSVFAALCACNTAYAEGSRDLVGYTDDNGTYHYYTNASGTVGHRPYLKWSAAETLGEPGYSVIYVYAKKDEKIYFGSSQHAGNVETVKAIAPKSTVGTDLSLAVDRKVGIAVTIPDESGKLYDPTIDTQPQYVLPNEDGKTNMETASDHKIYLFSVNKGDNGLGYIGSPEAEKAGPKYGDKTDGYTPHSFIAPTTGTYAFRFLSYNHSGYGWFDPWPSTQANSGWLENGQNADSQRNGNSVAAFDVTVVGTDGTEQKGRMWTKKLFCQMSDSGAVFYSKMYALTDDGFEYKFDFNGMGPQGFVLYSNNRGFLWDPDNLYKNNGDKDNLQSLNHSFYSKDGAGLGEPPTYDGGAIYPNFTPTDPDKDKTYKLFFNQAADEAVAHYNNNGLATDSEIAAKVDVFKNDLQVSYTGKRDVEDDYKPGDGVLGVSTKGMGGIFKISFNSTSEIDLPDQMSIELDFSGYALDAANAPILDENGEWKKRSDMTDTAQTGPEKSNKVVLTSTKSSDNTYTFKWPGDDCYGNVVPKGKYTQNISTYAVYGATHFPLLDVEHNTKGVIIEMINPGVTNFGTGKDKYTVYYNNTRIKQLFNPSADYDTGEHLADDLNKTAGVSSENGAMQYVNDRGDNTAIDIWSQYSSLIEPYRTIEVVDPAQTYKPILSFVDEDGVENTANTDLANSHIGTYDSNGAYTTTPKNTTGNQYGNTISTGFYATVKNAGNGTINNIQWTVKIPKPTAEGDKLYVKKLTDALWNGFTTEGNAALTDSDLTTLNKGAIYKVIDFSDSSKTEAKITIRDDISTTVTGSGSVLYGIVFDGIYATGATATVTYVNDTEADNDNLNVKDEIHASSFDEYLENEAQLFTSTDFNNALRKSILSAQNSDAASAVAVSIKFE